MYLTAMAHLRWAMDSEFVQSVLKTRSAALAFQVHLSVEAGKPAEEILPVLWEDNYLSLLPGEERTVEARFPGKHSIGSPAEDYRLDFKPVTLVISRRSPSSPR